MAHVPSWASAPGWPRPCCSCSPWRGCRRSQHSRRHLAGPDPDRQHGNRLGTVRPGVERSHRSTRLPVLGFRRGRSCPGSHRRGVLVVAVVLLGRQSPALAIARAWQGLSQVHPSWRSHADRRSGTELLSGSPARSHGSARRAVRGVHGVEQHGRRHPARLVLVAGDIEHQEPIGRLVVGADGEI